MAIKITAEELLDYANTLNGHELCTLHHGKPYSVVVVNQSLRYLTGPLRKETCRHNLQELRVYCEKFCESNSLHPTAYWHVIEGKSKRNFSYLLPIIVKFLAARVDGEFASSG